MKSADLRQWVRRGLASRSSRVITPLLSPLLRVPSLGSPGPPRHPFQVVVSIDAEAGYLRPDLSCAWSDVAPRALQGFTHGLPVLHGIARETGVPLSCLLSTQCFISPRGEGKIVPGILEGLLGDGHELGLHLHPRTDEVVHRALGRGPGPASAHFYDRNRQVEMIDAARGILRSHMGADVEGKLRSFRWGNWALGPESARALEETGFEIDSTALPGLSGNLDHDRKLDWSRPPSRYPFNLSRGAYQDSETGDSRTLELPVPTFSFMRSGLADPCWGALLASVMAYYHRNADRSRAPFVFVVCTHSCEMVYEDGSPTPYAKNLRDFIEFASTYDDVCFETLGGAADRFLACGTPLKAQQRGAPS